MPAFRLFTPVGDADDPLIPDVVSSYLEHLARRVKSGSFCADGFANTSRDLLRFSRAFPFPVSAAKSADLADCIISNEDWDSPHTKKRVAQAVITCFRWAADEGGLIDRCPYRRPKEIFALEYKTRRPAKADEYRQMMRHACIALKRVMLVLFRTGMRPCECFRLRWDEVDLESTPPRIKTFAKKRKRLVILDAVLAKMFRDIKAKAKSDFVFVNMDGNQWTRRTLCYRVAVTARRAGVPGFSLYGLRHLFACDAIKSGASSKTAADLLGNSPDMIERVYAVHTRDDVEYLRDAGKAVTDMRKKR